MMKVFKEVQKFTQWYILIVEILNIGLTLLFGYSVFKQIVLKQPFGDKPAPDLLLIVSFIILLSLTILFFLLKLTTRIDEKGIHYKFFPFHFSLKTIPWDAISSAEVRKYNAISEYGGWGLKGGFPFNRKRGKAINVSGNVGIQLVLKNDKKLLIGTQKENDVKRVLETYKHKIL